MRPTLEFKIENDASHKVISIVPDGREYQVFLDGQLHYGGTKFSLHDAKEKIDFLRKYLTITEIPITKTQDGKVLKPKRKRRTKLEMQAARRLQDKHKKRKRRTKAEMQAARK